MKDTLSPLDGITVSYVLEQIAAIASQTKHITMALDTLLGMHNGDSGECGAPGNVLGKAKAEAISAIVTSREATSRQVLHFYEKIYDDLMRLHFGEQPAPADSVPELPVDLMVEP